MDPEHTHGALSDAQHAEDVEALAAALQDKTRRRILLALLHDRSPRTVDDVAAFASVHRTVAFTHLERLVALGMLEKRPRRGRRGKPASLYAIRTPVLALSYPPRRFQVLAALLGGAIGVFGDGGIALARDQGRRYGVGLVAASASGVDDVLGALSAFGAGYMLSGDDIATRSCVFREACDEAREVVCSLHAGILEGALQAAGVSASVAPRGPVSTTGCHFGVSPSLPEQPP